VLEEQASAGLAACGGWVCRLFVVPAAAAAAAAAAGVAPLVGAGGVGAPCSGVLASAVMHEVPALHDGTRPLLWACTVAVAR
jgi:hypothetical protein